MPVAVSERRPNAAVHRSAVIAGACYASGVALDPVLISSIRQDLSGDAVMLISIIVFIGVVAGIQRYMGVALSARTTSTPVRLCTTGPFKYSRNPIYLSFVIPLAALSVFSITAASTSVAVYIFAMTRFVIRHEEQILRASFGMLFEDYVCRTPRWILRHRPSDKQMGAYQANRAQADAYAPNFRKEDRANAQGDRAELRAGRLKSRLFRPLQNYPTALPNGGSCHGRFRRVLQPHTYHPHL